MSDEPRWFYGIWFVAGDEMDYLASLFRKDGKLVLEYRFRYYSEESENPHDNKDRKCWYTATMKDDGTQENLLEVVRNINANVIPVIEAKFGAKADFIKLECRNDEPKFFFELAARPWIHLKIVGKA